MVTVYTYAKCSTCVRAVRFLEEAGIRYEERPIIEKPPGKAELRRMLAARGGEIRRLFNTSGLVYRDLGMKDRLPGMTSEEALELLAGNGRLIKRPFLIGPKVALCGFRPAEWQRQLVTGGR